MALSFLVANVVYNTEATRCRSCVVRILSESIVLLDVAALKSIEIAETGLRLANQKRCDAVLCHPHELLLVGHLLNRVKDYLVKSRCPVCERLGLHEDVLGFFG